MNRSVREITIRVVEPIDLGEEMVTEFVATRTIPVLLCANETCERKFLATERRAGAIYCSTRCARAQAQREYRRRQL